ncbi:MAG: YitT family protein [bacterium]
MFYKEYIALFKITEYLLLILGCLVIALSFNLFLCPNKVASGGLVGLSIVLTQLLKINPAYIQWGINLPLFFAGILMYGVGFGLKTIIGFFAIPMFILLTQGYSAVSYNELIASIVGGIGIGVGLGLIFKGNASVGGFSLAAQIMRSYTNIKLSSLTMLLNGIVILLAGFTFGFSEGFYAFLSLAITCVSIEIINFVFVFDNKIDTKVGEKKNV